MKVAHVEWDRGNLVHLLIDHAEREIFTDDVEQIIFALPNASRAVRTQYDGADQILFFGQTMGGRCLLVATEPFGNDGVRPITARPMTESEEEKYLAWCRTTKR